MNILDVQDKLKNFSEQQLLQEMQMPSGNAPQFLVLSEMTRRKRMRDSMASQGNSGTTVAEEVVASAGVPQGGIASMAQAMAPKSSIAQNTGVSPMQEMPQEMPQEPVMGMYGGGYVQKMAEGGIVVRNGRQYMELADGQFQDMRTGEVLPTEPRDNYLPTLSDTDRDSVMFSSDMRAFQDRDPYYRAKADSLGLSTEAVGAKLDRELNPEGSLMYNAGYPSPEMYPAALPSTRLVNRWERGGIGPAAAGRSADSIYVDYLMREMGYGGDAGAVDLDLTSVNPSYSEVGPDRFPEADPYAPISVRAATPPPVLNPMEAFSENVDFQTSEVAPPIALAAPEEPKAWEEYYGEVPEGPNPSLGERAELFAKTVFGDEAIKRAFPERPEPPPTPRETVESPFGFGLPGASIEGRGDLTLGVPGVTAADLFRPEGAGAGPSLGITAADTAPPPAVSPVVDIIGGGPGGPGGGGASASAAPMSSYEQELVNAMQRAEKRAQQDKWLALAQVGLGLMSSTQPTLGGAIGEAGAQGLGSFREARDNYEQERLGLTKALYELQGQQAAALASQRRAGSKTIDPYAEINRLTNLRDALVIKSPDPNGLGGSVETIIDEGAYKQLNDRIVRLTGEIVAPVM